MAQLKILPVELLQLTYVNLQVKHPDRGVGLHIVGYLDIAIHCPSLSLLSVGALPSGSGAGARFERLEQFDLQQSNLRSANSMFASCHTLANIVNFNLSTTPATTFTAALNPTGNVVELPNHGLTNDTVVMVKTIDPAITSIYELNEYHVINATQNTFQIAYTSRGAARTINAAGTATFAAGISLYATFGADLYALQSIPTFPASNVVSLEMAFSRSRIVDLPPLDVSSCVSMAMMCENSYVLRSCSLMNTGNVLTANYAFNGCSNLRTVEGMDLTSCTTTEEMFSFCYALNHVGPLTLAVCTNFLSMFDNCLSLQHIPHMNLSTGTQFNAMFRSCSSLRHVPDLNFGTGDCSNAFDGCNYLATVGNITTGSSAYRMFYNCSSLTHVASINSSTTVNFSYMFSGCKILSTVPMMDTSQGLDFSWMFYNCEHLQTIPAFNTVQGQTFSSMFRYCMNLETIPLIDTSSGLDFSNMFEGCNLLKSVPLLDTSSGTDFSWMFSICAALTTIPTLNTSMGTSFASMFGGNMQMMRVPALDLGAATSSAAYSSMFQNCPLLNSIEVINVKYSLNLMDCNLSPAACDVVYGNLASPGAGQTLTMTRVWGRPTSTTSIATTKGWTVTAA